VHNRMPVILDSQHAWDWIGEKDPQKLQLMLTPFPAERMQAHAVGRYVNNPGFEGPETVQPLPF